MRKITQEAQNAIASASNFCKGNTAVIVSGYHDIAPQGIYLTLHGHQIAAVYPDGTKRFSLCGWPTATTRERLKAAGIIVHQKDHKQFYGDVELDTHGVYELSVAGELTMVKQNHYN